MKKKLFSILLVGVLVMGLTGCGNSAKENNKSDSSSATKGNCDVFKCLEKLNSSMTVEEMNKVIGFEGKLVSDEETYKTYSWDLTDDTSIRSQFMLKYNTATISANYPSSMVTKKADFSKWNEIQAKLKSKEKLSYKEFVKLVGGVEGTIKQKTDTQTTYSWYNSKGGYLSGYFDKDGNCTMATGRF